MMTPQIRLVLWIVGLFVVAVYGFWRSYRVALFQADMMTFREELRGIRERVAVSDVSLVVAIDYLLCKAIEEAPRLALFDFTLAHLISRGREATPDETSEVAFQKISLSSDSQEFQIFLYRLFWRLLRYLCLESISGLVCVLGWASSIAFRSLATQKPSPIDVAGRVIGIIATAGQSNRPGTSVIAH